MVDENDDEFIDEEGRPVLTKALLLNMFKKDKKQYYETFECNYTLYLNRKGYPELRNMNLFPKLKCLYFIANGKYFQILIDLMNISFL